MTSCRHFDTLRAMIRVSVLDQPRPRLPAGFLLSHVSTVNGSQPPVLNEYLSRLRPFSPVQSGLPTF